VRGFLKQFAPDVFRPEEISVLEDALDDAWRRIERSKAPWASEDYFAAGRTILAKYIITMAKGGERDPNGWRIVRFATKIDPQTARSRLA
jgi:hypothetical protein